MLFNPNNENPTKHALSIRMKGMKYVNGVIKVEKVNEIKKRLAEASDGEWFAEEDERTWELYTDTGHMMPLKLLKIPKVSKEYAEYPPTKGDAAFIVHAKRDIEWLLSEVERLNQELSRQK